MNYNPYGFTGNSYPQMPVQQNVTNPYAFQQTSQANSYINVNSLEEAKNYPIQPSTTKMMVDANNPYIYIKTANAMGQVSIQYFKTTPISEDEIKSPSANSATSYASKEDILNLSKRIEALEKAKGE